MKSLKAVGVDFDGEAFIVTFDYDPEIVASVKELPQRKWDPDNKRWLVKDSAQLRSFIKHYYCYVSEQAHGALLSEKKRLGVFRQDGPRIVLESQYDPRLVEAIRTITGRKWDQETKRWKFPLTAIKPLKQLAAQFDVEWQIDDDSPIVDPIEVPTVTVKGGQFVIYTTYDRDVLDAIKEMPGVSWDRREAAFRVPLECVVEIDEFVTRFDGVLDGQAQELISSAGDTIALFRASSATEANLQIDGLSGTLMPFQQAGVVYALRVLGFDPKGTE